MSKSRWTLDPVKEAQAARALRESLGAMAEDGELFIDMVEGETGLFEAIDLLLRGAVEDRAMVEGLEKVISDLKTRQARFEKRIDSTRTLIEQAMMIAEIEEKVQRPIATLTLAKRAPKVVIETEADIPSDYWKPGAPTLDKAAVLAALKARRAALDALPDDPEARAQALAELPPDIPGASLSNAAPSLSWRFA